MAKVGDVLKFRDRGLSVEEARKAMLAAGEAPKGLIPPAGATVAVEEPAQVVPELPEVVDTGSVPGVSDEERAFINQRLIERGLGQGTRVELNIDQLTQLIGSRDLAERFISGNLKIAGTVEDIIEPALETEEPKPAPPAKTAVQPPPPPEPARSGNEPQKVETDKFIGEIFQEKGKWVAQIRYKNGAGTERFEEITKNDLMLALLRGKGNGTLRVRAAVRREKLGGDGLDKEYPLPQGMTVERFEKLSEEDQDALLNTIVEAQAAQFRLAHPEYYNTEKNNKALIDFLNSMKRPLTAKNYEFAYEDLMADDVLDKRPEPEPPAPVAPAPAATISAPPAAPAAGDSAPALAPPASAPAPAAPAAAPAPVVRKRGTTGLQPGHTSSPSEIAVPGDGGTPREPSEAELRKMPLKDLARIANEDRRRRSSGRR